MTPDYITFRAPQGWIVRIDEDGVSLHPGDRALEQVEVERLLVIVNTAIAMRADGTAPIPAPPTQEEARQMYAAARTKENARRAIRAIKAEFNDDDVPF
jgi:hypothetical protein